MTVSLRLSDDYQALRHHVAGRLVPRDVLALRGPDAVTYLQGQCSQDVAGLSVGRSADALLLSPQGKLEALLRVVRADEDAFLLDVDGGWGSAVRRRLERFKLRVKVELDSVELRCLALRGPDAAAVAQDVGGDHRVDFSWNAVTGVDVFGPSLSVPDDVPSSGLPAWEALRVEAGIPAMGSEIDERTIPAEAGLLERCVSFTKGCYTGQELVARLDARGNKVARHLVGFVVTGWPGDETVAESIGAPVHDEDDKGPLPTGTVVLADSAHGDDGAVVGAVTSSARSPVLGVVALGYLHRRVTPPAAVVLRTAGGATMTAEARLLPLVG